MKIVFTPDWFLGSDVIIEFVSFLVLAAFFILAYRNYKLNKNRNSFYLGIGFFFIALAELATIVTKLVLYYDFDFSREIGQMVVSYHVVKSVDILYYLGFFFHKLLTLGGLYVIYRTPLKRNYSNDAVFAICFFIIAAIFSNLFYFIFHFTALLLLVFIISNYCQVCKKNKSKNTKVLIAAFSMLALSQVIFILSRMNICYAIAQILQLVSYLILLFLIIRIVQHGRKKKKQGRHSI